MSDLCLWHAPPYFVETGSLTETEVSARLTGKSALGVHLSPPLPALKFLTSARLTGKLAPEVPLSPLRPALELLTYTAMSSFYVCAEDSNSDPHACTTDTFPFPTDSAFQSQPQSLKSILKIEFWAQRKSGGWAIFKEWDSACQLEVTEIRTHLKNCWADLYRDAF